MNKLLTMTILSISLVGCGQSHKPKADLRISLGDDSTAKSVDPNYTDDFRKNLENNPSYTKDNSGVILEDREKGLKTAENQSSDATDREVTQKVRKVLMNDDQLSIQGKNVKIISNHGAVTLRGLVNTNAEKEQIEQKVQNISGVQRVDNQLDVKDIEMGH